MLGKKKQAKRVDFEQQEPEDEVLDESDLYPESDIPPVPKPIPQRQPTKQRVQPQQQVEPSPVWIVHDTPTETQRVIVNTQERKAYDLYSAIVEILNRTEE